MRLYGRSSRHDEGYVNDGREDAETKYGEMMKKCEKMGKVNQILSSALQREVSLSICKEIERLQGSNGEDDAPDAMRRRLDDMELEMDVNNPTFFKW